MCAEKYPLRVKVSDAQKVNKKTENNPADVIITRQLRTDKAEQLYEIEQEHCRTKRTDLKQRQLSNKI